MEILDNVACTSDYRDAATISGVYGSTGGYFSIQGGDVYAELQYGRQGQLQWTREIHIPEGNGTLAAYTTGIRFRNYLPATVATVSAALSAPSEPPIFLQAGGQSTPLSGTYTTYTPASSGLSVGSTGIVYGRYTRIGNNVQAAASLVFGGAGISGGGGVMTFNLPVAARLVVTGATPVLGYGYYVDAGTGNIAFFDVWGDSTGVNMILVSSVTWQSTLQQITGITPWAPVAGSVLSWALDYEAA